MMGNLSPQEIEEVLAAHYIGHLGCHADGFTYVVPIGYAYDNEYLYGHSEEGLKISIMRKNPSVCFQLEDMHDMSNWKSVIAWGDFEELTTNEGRQTALTVLLNRRSPHVSSRTARLTPQWPFIPDDKRHIPGVVFRIKFREKTGRFERSEGGTSLPDVL